MQDRITRACSAISSDEIQRAVLSTSNRFTACMADNDDHFEHMLCNNVNRHVILVSFYAFANAFVKGQHHDLM